MDMKKFLYAYYTVCLRYLINNRKPSPKVNQKIYKLHMKLNKLENHLNSHSEKLEDEYKPVKKNIS